MVKFNYAVLILVVASTAEDQLSRNRNGPEITFTSGSVDYTFFDNKHQLGMYDQTPLCKTGVWVTYASNNFQMGEWPANLDTGIEIFPELETTCHKPMSERIFSARFIGVQSDYSAPSATFFTEPNLVGKSMGFESSIPEINATIHSMVTIDTNVEFFQDANYEGESICYEIHPFFCLHKVCWVWTFDIEQIPWDITTAKSAKAGCPATKMVYRQTWTNHADSPSYMSARFALH